MISESALTLLGIQTACGSTWKQLRSLSADAVVLWLGRMWRLRRQVWRPRWLVQGRGMAVFRRGRRLRKCRTRWPPQGGGASHESSGGIDAMSLSVVGKNVAIIAGMTVLYALAASVYRYGSGAWMKGRKMSEQRVKSAF